MKYFVLFFLLITGCAYPKRGAEYKSQPTSKDKATVYVYRILTDIDSANPDIPRFYINDKQLGKLMIRGYYVTQVDPGEIDIYHKDTLFGVPLPWSMMHIKMPVEAGKKYFFKFSIETVFRTKEFKLVPEKQGEEEIKSTVLLIP